MSLYRPIATLPDLKGSPMLSLHQASEEGWQNAVKFNTEPLKSRICTFSTKEDPCHYALCSHSLQAAGYYPILAPDDGHHTKHHGSFVAVPHAIPSGFTRTISTDKKIWENLRWISNFRDGEHVPEPILYLHMSADGGFRGPPEVAYGPEEGDTPYGHWEQKFVIQNQVLVPAQQGGEHSGRMLSMAEKVGGAARRHRLNGI